MAIAIGTVVSFGHEDGDGVGVVTGRALMNGERWVWIGTDCASLDEDNVDVFTLESRVAKYTGPVYEDVRLLQIAMLAREMAFRVSRAAYCRPAERDARNDARDAAVAELRAACEARVKAETVGA